MKKLLQRALSVLAAELLKGVRRFCRSDRRLLRQLCDDRRLHNRRWGRAQITAKGANCWPTCSNFRSRYVPQELSCSTSTPSEGRRRLVRPDPQWVARVTATSVFTRRGARAYFVRALTRWTTVAAKKQHKFIFTTARRSSLKRAAPWHLPLLDRRSDARKHTTPWTPRPPTPTPAPSSGTAR